MTPQAHLREMESSAPLPHMCANPTTIMRRQTYSSFVVGKHRPRFVCLSMELRPCLMYSHVSLRSPATEKSESLMNEMNARYRSGT